MIMESEMSAQDLMHNGLTPDDSASEVIHFDKHPQQRTLEMALSILKNTTCVEPELMEKMLKNFHQGLPFQSGLSFPDVKLMDRIVRSLPHNNAWVKIKKFFLSCFKK
jgi:hypothetical protein